jgi:uncharacterized damage-inducible protein DinB
MENTALEQLRFPIGKFHAPEYVSEDQLAQYIMEISNLPQLLANEVSLLSKEQLDKPYREGGWSIRQVVHHLTDSHMNAIIRHKLTLTEDNPTIKPYNEAAWAELADYKETPIAVSLGLLQNLHIRWSIVLKSLNQEDLKRTFIHPEHNKTFRLDVSIALYAWHGKHHLAHITSLKQRMGWH